MEQPEPLPENKEFVEVAHSGGQITITSITQENGNRLYQMTYSHSRPTAAGLFEIFAVAPGIPVADVNMGGIGSPPPVPPLPGAFQVFIASDSQGLFGRLCPSCQNYWRSRATGSYCPYCGRQAPPFMYTTDAQGAYIAQFCTVVMSAISSEEDGDHVIDLDAVADAIRDTEKPPFYYTEQSQQNRFKCRSCHNINDILRRFGYCTLCGTRNDLQELDEKIIPEIRNRINTERTYENCVKDAVSAFDTLVGQYVKEAVRRTPMTESRRNRLMGKRFHNLKQVAQELSEIFDWDLFRGISQSDVTFATLMFYRRHLYEHNGGEVDQEYLDNSGDTTVKLKQALRETQSTAHEIANVVSRMAKNIHLGFHELYPPIAKYKNYPVQKQS